MAISYVGENDGGDNIALPGFVASDLAVVMATVGNSQTIPALPAGWNNINSGGGGLTPGMRIGYRILQAGDTTIGSWAGATRCAVLVFRGTNASSPIGANSLTRVSGTTVTFSALGLSVTDGTSMVIGFVNFVNSSNCSTRTLAGMTTRSGSWFTSGWGGHTGAVSAWSTQTFVVSATSPAHRVAVIELKAPTIALGRSQAVFVT